MSGPMKGPKAVIDGVANKASLMLQHRDGALGPRKSFCERYSEFPPKLMQFAPVVAGKPKL